jgi:DNA integrity scanning protein DisA with diadenylate cyclase activity
VSSKDSDFFTAFIGAAINLVSAAEADALVVFLEKEVDWDELKNECGEVEVVIVSMSEELLEEASEHGLPTVFVEIPDATVAEMLTQALLDAVAHEYIKPGATIVSAYRGFDKEKLDTITVLKLSERLGRLTARDLQRLETKVPLETLKVVVDLAVAIGREGREGKPVGTMFVVGDHRKVLEQSQPAGFDAVKGYPRKERNLFDKSVRERIKEVAQMDGAFIVSADGTVESTCRIIDTNPVELTMTSGLGTRHYTGAAISKNTKAIAVVVSESSGTVRIFQNGQIVLRIEPLRRPMKWKNPSGTEPADGVIQSEGKAPAS